MRRTSEILSKFGNGELKLVDKRQIIPMCHRMPTFYLKILIYWCKTDCCLTAADSGSDDSGIENQPDDLENRFDLVGELDVEEELDMDKFVDIKLAQKESGALSKIKETLILEMQ
ncbi:hypothetical protein T09_11948 [Trichinella sp. T9]|nr:hypothetical protein T09_11948 [Trichinella sp. T9]